MPNVHRNKAITPRPDPELKRRADEAVAALGMTLNGWVIASLEYLVGDRDEPPPRPRASSSVTRASEQPPQP